jgi:hypothetical protein
MGGRQEQVPEIARLVVPVGLGALTWLAAALSLGVVATLQELSPLALVVPVLVVALFLPVYRARPWEAGATDRTLAWARRHNRAIALAAGLFALSRLPVVGDLLAPAFGLVLLPVRVVPQVLYGATLFYDATVGPPLGDALFDLGRWYVELLWLYVLGVGVEKLFPEGRP